MRSSARRVSTWGWDFWLFILGAAAVIEPFLLLHVLGPVVYVLPVVALVGAIDVLRTPRRRRA